MDAVLVVDVIVNPMHGLPSIFFVQSTSTCVVLITLAETLEILLFMTEATSVATAEAVVKDPFN